MKKKVSSLLIVLLFLGSISSFTQTTKKEEFKVYGNCGLCKKRIIKATKSVDGVSEADWNKETKILKISYDSSKTNVHEVHKVIAKVGHDTDMYKADDEKYRSLPKCCRYDRKSE